jgi:hypothetical protein
LAALSEPEASCTHAILTGCLRTGGWVVDDDDAIVRKRREVDGESGCLERD